ncbi:MAG: nucleoside-diphosphate kinase [Candidatus Poribacteria bacterium]|nr:MAG: nucleoside-diphosphate kinase [Candidatus Poribacteria bacterium]
MERTFVLLKPDAVQRGLVGEILQRFERKGLKIVGLKMLQVDPQLAQMHYAAHRGKPFYQRLIRFITAGPSVALALEGEQAVHRVRLLVGVTDPNESQPGTIRGDLSAHVTLNLIHASDSPETAQQELALFFKPDELFSYTRCDEPWLKIAE